jgi:hypothetical protein
MILKNSKVDLFKILFIFYAQPIIGGILMEETKMTDAWAEDLTCATQCTNCDKKMGADDQRILSVYSHQAICIDCKQEEEHRPDYEEVSKQMIGQCLIDTEMKWGDPQGYCYHHFYPYKC